MSVEVNSLWLTFLPGALSIPPSPWIGGTTPGAVGTGALVLTGFAPTA